MLSKCKNKEMNREKFVLNKLLSISLGDYLFAGYVYCGHKREKIEGLVIGIDNQNELYNVDWIFGSYYVRAEDIERIERLSSNQFLNRITERWRKYGGRGNILAHNKERVLNACRFLKDY